MADSDSESSGSEIIRDWTLVNEFGEVDSDESSVARVNLRTEADEAALADVASSTTDLSISSMTATVVTVEQKTFCETSTSTDDRDLYQELSDTGDVEQDLGADLSAVTAHELSGEQDGEQSQTRDEESLSSGSSIELLDMVDEEHITESSSLQRHLAEKLQTDVVDSSQPVVGQNAEAFSPPDVAAVTTGHSQSEALEPAAVADEIDDAPITVSQLALSSSSSGGSSSYDRGDDVIQAECSLSLTASLRAERPVTDELQSAVTVAEPEAIQTEQESQRELEPSIGATSENELMFALQLSTVTSSIEPAETHSTRVDLEENENVLEPVDEHLQQQLEQAELPAAAGSASLEERADETEATEDSDMSIISSVTGSIESLPSDRADSASLLADADMLDQPGDEVEAEAELPMDDRCESDISGVATDDSDLSSMTPDADIAMEMGNAVYRHQPNPVFNTLLTCVSVLVMCFAIGIGVGHYYGSSTMPLLCEQQVNRLRALQDEQYLCLGRLEHYEDQLRAASDAEQKLSAVTGVWTRKYEEIVKERAQLEQMLNESLQVNAKSLESVDYYRQQLADSQTAVQYLVQDIDQLTHNWNQKYQLLRADRDELEQELLSTRGEADESADALYALQLSVRQLETDKTSSHAELTSEIADLKNVVNQQRQERAELQSLILSQRYTQHPGNAAAATDAGDGDGDDEDDAVNNTDAGQAPHEDDPAKLSAFQNASSPAEKLSLEFVRLQNLLHNAVETAKTDAKDRGNEHITDDEAEWRSDAIFLIMLRHVMSTAGQSASLQLPDQMLSYHKILHRVADCVEVLSNVTAKHQLKTNALLLSWNQLNERVKESREKSPKSLRKNVDKCQKQFASACSTKGDKNSDQAKSTDDIFRRYMNRTLQTVSKLSHTVQTTLDRMKTLPEELFPENKTAKKISRKLTEAVSKLNDKVQSGWKHIVGKFADVRKKWFGYTESKKTCKHKERERKSDEKHRKKHDDSDGKSRQKPLTEPNEKVEDRKRKHKQTKSTTRDDEPRSEKRQEFDATGQTDDFTADGFFEDNQRAWSRSNDRRLRKTGRRIHRLNEEMFLSMDDDDVEDIYEDLKDVREDGDDHDPSDKQRTWLSCQLLWWKTRLHRKHRAEDLVKGCGRQLMHWQLRVLCKALTADRLGSSSSSFLRDLCDAVIPRKRNTAKMPPPYGHSQQCHGAACGGKCQGGSRDNGETVRPLDRLLSVNDSASDWYFRRVQDREDHHQQLSPQWYFDRMTERQFSRSDANWYVRSMHRQFYPGGGGADRHARFMARRSADDRGHN